LVLQAGQGYLESEVARGVFTPTTTAMRKWQARVAEPMYLFKRSDERYNHVPAHAGV